MNLLDYKLQKTSLILLLIFISLSFLYSLSFSTEVTTLCLDKTYQQYYEIYDKKCDTHVMEVAPKINEVYGQYLKVNDIILKLSVVGIILVGFLFMIGCYSRKRYTLFQNIMTKAIPIYCIIISIVSLVLIFNLRTNYLSINFEYFNEFITTIDNANYAIFPDNMVITQSTTFIDFAPYIYSLLILSSLFMIITSLIKMFKINKNRQIKSLIQLKEVESV